MTKQPFATSDEVPAEAGFPSGLLEDNRPAEQKAKDFLARELYGAKVPVLTFPDYQDWQNNEANKKMLKTFAIQNQDGSYSCVAQSGALALAINNYIEEGHYERMSPRSIYPRRRNKPGKGMWIDDLGNICTTQGVIFEGVLPSEGLGEDAMNDLSDFLPSYESIAKIYRPKHYVWLGLTIDEVAGILAQGKPVVLALQFDNGEWAKEVPTLANKNSTAQYGHAITALPRAFFMYNGQRAIMIQDSWGVDSGMNGRRILTQDWFRQGRVKSAIWFEDLQNLAVLNDVQGKPSFKFDRNLTAGMRGNDVAMLQRCLGYLKDEQGFLFALNVPPTGYYGGITRAGVKRFQAMYGLPITGNVDNPTMETLNKLFA